MISIIIPIYNAEKYLHECIDSILAQTYKNWELLLIDDGSPDSCPAICDDYAKKDNRIKVFHKENGGVSSARNLGLENASGEWICFVDADDYISANYLECIDSNYDITFVESNTVSAHGETKTRDKLYARKYRTKNDLSEFFCNNLNTSIARVPWGKIIKRTVIGDTRFIDGQRIGEDTVFMFQIYQKKPTLSITNGYYYYWREDIVNDQSKYTLPTSTSIEYMSNIWKNYIATGYKDIDLEFFLLTCFFSLSKKDSRESLKQWFSNALVHTIEQRLYSSSCKLPRSYELSKRYKSLGLIYWNVFNVFNKKRKAKNKLITFNLPYNK